MHGSHLSLCHKEPAKGTQKAPQHENGPGCDIYICMLSILIDYLLYVRYNDTLFDECNETNTGLMGKVEECLNYDLTKNEDGWYCQHQAPYQLILISSAKCLCWENIIFKIDKLKSNTFIPQGNETRNCIQAISYSAPMIKDIQLNCTDTVIGKKRFLAAWSTVIDRELQWCCFASSLMP